MGISGRLDEYNLSGFSSLGLVMAESHSPSASSRSNAGLSGFPSLGSVSGFMGTSVTRKLDLVKRFASRSLCNRLGSF